MEKLYFLISIYSLELCMGKSVWLVWEERDNCSFRYTTDIPSETKWLDKFLEEWNIFIQ